MNTETAPHFPDADKEKQSRLLVTWPHGKLARATRLQDQTVSALASARYPVTLFRGFEFAYVQEDYRLLASLSERIGGIFFPPRHRRASIRAIEFSEVIKDFGGFFSLFEKVKRGVKLTDSEMRELESRKQSIGDILEVTIEQARQDRLPKSNPDDN